MRDWNSDDFDVPESADAAALGIRLTCGRRFIDERGTFRKIAALPSNSSMQVREVFVSWSAPGVVRGIHTATSGFQGDKLVCVLGGEVTDVLVDLRPGENLGRVCSFQLNSGSPAIVIPAGVAHGFQVTSSSDAQLLYITSNAYSQEADTGVNPLTLPFEWPRPISRISERDSSLPSLDSVLREGGIPFE